MNIELMIGSIMEALKLGVSMSDEDRIVYIYIFFLYFNVGLNKLRFYYKFFFVFGPKLCFFSRLFSWNYPRRWKRKAVRSVCKIGELVRVLKW